MLERLPAGTLVRAAGKEWRCKLCAVKIPRGALHVEDMTPLDGERFAFRSTSSWRYCLACAATKLRGPATRRIVKMKGDST